MCGTMVDAFSIGARKIKAVKPHDWRSFRLREKKVYSVLSLLTIMFRSFNDHYLRIFMTSIVQ